MTLLSSDIRRLISSDVDEFRNLRLIALKDHPKIYLQILEEEQVKQKSFHIGMINENVVVGIFVDNVLVGYTILTVMLPTKLKHKAYMWGIYVNPNFRQLGLAKKMQEWLFMKCSNFGVRTLHSTVVATNISALTFHHSMGYIQMYKEDNAIRHYDGSFDDLIHLVKYVAKN